IINISRLIEKIIKLTVILAIPSKILGAILGLIEGVIMAFLVVFIMFHLPQTESTVAESKVAIVLLERSPIIGAMAVDTTLALEEINEILEEMREEEDRESVNIQ